MNELQNILNGSVEKERLYNKLENLNTEGNYQYYVSVEDNSGREDTAILIDVLTDDEEIYPNGISGSAWIIPSDGKVALRYLTNLGISLNDVKIIIKAICEVTHSIIKLTYADKELYEISY